MSDLLLLTALGFLGSFGHCVSMCGPLAIAFSLAPSRQPSVAEGEQRLPSRWQSVRFHLALNLGRLLSYALVGLALGALGSMVVWSGQLAGVGSGLRRAIALFTGFLLIWFGLRQTCPGLLPKIPLSLVAQGRLHLLLDKVMRHVASSDRPWMPGLLGIAWGLMPCGFLFAAQLKAMAAGAPTQGALMMLFFGLGTLPTMVGIGVTSSLLSQNRRSQLFRAGGWVAIAIGILTLTRTGDLMVDYTGYGAILCLVLALIARPIHRLWAAPLHYRRVLGVGAFVLSIAHIIHRIEHTWNWRLDALAFMPPVYQQGIVLGLAAILLLTPLALTSFDGAQRYFGKRWRTLHLLSVPALLLVALHSVLVGSSFLGSLQLTWLNYTLTGLLGAAVTGTLVVRSPWFWSFVGLKRFYTLSHAASTPSPSAPSSPAPSSSSHDASCHTPGIRPGATRSGSPD